MFGQILSAIRHDDPFALREDRKGPGQLGRAGLLMMTKGLAIGRDHHRRSRRLRERDVGQPIRQMTTVAQQIAERDLAGKLSLEAKYRDTQIALPPLEGPGLARPSRYH